jgi:hypothetical protein
MPCRRYVDTFREVDVISLGGVGTEMGRMRPSRCPQAPEWSYPANVAALIVRRRPQITPAIAAFISAK